MGGHKLHFYHAKRKKPTCASLVVSFPLKYYLSQPRLSIDTLSSLPPQSLPESWTVAAKHPLTIVKLRILNTTGVPRVDVVITVSVQDDLTWGLSVLNIVLDPFLSPSLHNIAPTLTSISALLYLIQAIDRLMICVGNPEIKFLELWKHRSLTLHGSSGMLLSVFTTAIQ